MIKATLVVVIALFCLPDAYAQTEKKKENVFLHPDKFYRKYFPHLRVKKNPPDSLYIKTYPNYLSVAMHVLSPAIQANLSPRGPRPGDYNPSSKFKTNISDVVGFSATYRFVSFGFAFLLKSGMNTHPDYAPSRYRTATIKYNSKAYAWQFKFIRIQGFTDVSQASGRSPNPAYTLRPDMLSKEFQFEGLYNVSWRKYSYIGPLTFAQRQIKSHAGFLLKGGVYYNRLSSDSTILNARQQNYYADFNDVKAIRSVSVRFAPGIGGNLILLKHLYFSASAFTSFDLYFYKYLKLPDEKANGRTTLLFVMEGKASLGYQSKRLYAGLRYEAERRAGNLHGVDMRNIYGYTGIELGYRFDAPRAVKKVYKETMPPGM